MSIFEYDKEKQIQQEIESLFEGKFRVSREGLKDFLKREEPKCEITSEIEPVVEEEESEELSIEEIEVPEEEFEEQIVKPPKIMDRLLDEYEDPRSPQKIETSQSHYLAYGGGGENNAMRNVGGGVGIYKDKDASILQIKSLSATGSTTITEVGDLIVITSLSGTDSWTSVSGDYYTSNEVDNLISASSGTNVLRITSADSPYNLTDEDNVVFSNSLSGTIVVNLPVGVEGRHFRITNTSNTDVDVSIVPNGTEKLFGDNLPFSLKRAETIDIYFNSIDGWW